jgi:UDP-glucose 4-epimerase
MLGLAERVKARTGSDSPMEIIPYDQAYGEGFEDMERRQPDTTRIRNLIGWRAEHSLDEIIDATADHIRANVTA